MKWEFYVPKPWTIRYSIDKGFLFSDEGIKEMDKTKTHPFVGRLDRACEICGRPDRDEIHEFKVEEMKE